MHHWLVAVGTPRKNKQQTHPLMSRPFLTFLSLSKSPVSAEQVTSDHPLSLFSFFQYPLLNFPTVYSIPKPPFPPLFLFIINNRHSINIQLGSFFCFLGEKVVFLTKMGSISFVNSQTLKLFPSFYSFLHSKQPCIVSMYHYSHKVALAPSLSLPKPKDGSFRLAAGLITNSVPSRNGNYTVGDFMTRKEDLHVVKATTSVDEALEALVEKRVTGFPVIDDDWNLVGVVSDYDLLALDSISGSSQNDTTLFPNVDSSWKTFNEIQKLMNKNNGKVVGDLMTPSPLIVRETTNLEDAARLLLETKYRRLPVVDIDGKLVGIITRGNVVRAALQIKRSIES